MKKRIHEALGVPENIIDSAIKLYEYISAYVSGLRNIESEDVHKIQIIGDFRISDMNLKKVNLKVELDKNKIDSFILLSMGQSSENVINSMFEMKAIINPDEIDMSIEIATPEQFKDEELSEFIRSNKKYLIPIIAHELKHGYDIFKKNTYNLYKKVEYNVFSSNSFGKIKPLTEVLFNSYYIHHIENLVRPTELAAQIQLEKITPEQFKNFFLENKIYQTLKKIQNFTIEGLKNELESYITEINDLLDHIGENYVSEQEKIDRVLELFYINITNWKNEKIINYIYPFGVDNPLFAFMQTPEKNNYLDEFFKKSGKFDGNYLSFFKNEEKYQRYTASNMIKKLARLYELTYKNIEEPRKPKPILPENKSIWNWDLYQKIKGGNSSITNKIITKEEFLSDIANKLNNKIR